MYWYEPWEIYGTTVVSIGLRMTCVPPRKYTRRKIKKTINSCSKTKNRGQIGLRGLYLYVIIYSRSKNYPKGERNPHYLQSITHKAKGLLKFFRLKWSRYFHKNLNRSDTSLVVVSTDFSFSNQFNWTAPRVPKGP